MIPKNIYQTWKTQDLNIKIIKLRKKILEHNKDYNLTLYTDDQMIEFVNSNYDNDVFNSFQKINNIVSKADFWRYLILYKYGGIYLDIDSSINKDLSSLIDKKDSAVITGEQNTDCFVQWALIFENNHPILEETINNLLANMSSQKFKNDVLSFSVKPYWDAVNNYLSKLDNNFSWSSIDKNTNVKFNVNGMQTRFYGVDYNEYFSFKHKYNHLLRDKRKGSYTKDHWTITQNSDVIY